MLPEKRRIAVDSRIAALNQWSALSRYKYGVPDSLHFSTHPFGPTQSQTYNEMADLLRVNSVEKEKFDHNEGHTLHAEDITQIRNVRPFFVHISDHIACSGGCNRH